jgi:hypothetical protein
MSKFFTPYQNSMLSPRERYEQKYKASRYNLLLVIVFTAINLVLLVTNADSYFLFSAFIPYYIVGTGMFLCGRFPEEYYEGMEDMTFLDTSVFVVLLVIAVVLTLVYLLAFFLSDKKRVGWLIFALAFFGLDTIGMLVIQGFSVESILDIAFHGWVIYDLTMGIVAYYKLKKLPPEEDAAFADGAMPDHVDWNGEIPEAASAEAAEGAESAEAAKEQDSFAIREADFGVKHRVLAETRLYNYDICYRRVKATHTNELVINGKVYDEIEGRMEYPHVLKAKLDGHVFEAVYNGTHSLIVVDGQEAARKLRLY